MNSYCSNKIASRKEVNARLVPHGTHRDSWGQACPHKYCLHVFALHISSLGQFPEDLVLFPSRPPGPLGGRPAVPFSLPPITSLYLVLPPPPPRCIITSFCIWLPTGSVHGKPKALAAAQSTALLLILGRWFYFPPSFPIQISHINDFVHSEKLKIIPLPSAKSELVLLRFVVMPCHEDDKVTKTKVFIHIHMHM